MVNREWRKLKPTAKGDGRSGSGGGFPLVFTFKQDRKGYLPNGTLIKASFSHV